MNVVIMHARRTSNVPEAAPPSAPNTPPRRSDPNESQTVLRACEVLKAFRVRGEDLSLTDVIDRTGLPKSTVFRLLRTLVHGGLLERVSSSRYRNRFSPVSARACRISFAAQGGSGFCDADAPPLCSSPTNGCL